MLVIDPPIKTIEAAVTAARIGTAETLMTNPLTAVTMVLGARPGPMTSWPTKIPVLLTTVNAAVLVFQVACANVGAELTVYPA